MSFSSDQCIKVWKLNNDHNLIVTYKYNTNKEINKAILLN